jgi:hypothetical protein
MTAGSEEYSRLRRLGFEGDEDALRKLVSQAVRRNDWDTAEWCIQQLRGCIVADDTFSTFRKVGTDDLYISASTQYCRGGISTFREGFENHAFAFFGALGDLRGRVNEGRAYGGVVSDYSESHALPLSDVTHVVEEVGLKEHRLLTTLRVLDTPRGQILRGLIESKLPFHVVCTVEKRMNQVVNLEVLDFIRIDLKQGHRRLERCE